MKIVEQVFNFEGARATAVRYPIYALALLTLANFLNYIDRQVLPAVAPLMLRDPKLGLSDAELGYIEASLLLSFTLFAPLFGLLGDRLPRARLMAMAAVVWSIATALTGVVTEFVVEGRWTLSLFGLEVALSTAALALCAVRALVGVGESAYSTITPSLIADYFPPQQRATALGIFQAAIPVGFALGFVIGGVLAHFFGWRVAFMLVGVPGLVTAAFIWQLREPPRGALDAMGRTDRRRVDSGPWWIALRRILSTRDWLISTAGYTALTAALGAFATWATVLLARDKGMSETGAAVTLGIIALLGGAMGTFGGGWLSDRLARRRHDAYFSVCAASTLLAVLPTLVALIADEPVVYLVATLIAVILLSVSNAPFHAILLQSVSATERATAVALNIVIIHAFGDAISRAAVGVLSDAIKDGQLPLFAATGAAFGIDPVRQHLSVALLITPLLLAISALFFFCGARWTGKRKRAV